MDLQTEINKMVRRAIMEEINNLAIRATMREKIEAAGITHDEIRKMITDTIDSYMRSAMNGNVEERIKQIYEAEIRKKVNETIEKSCSAFLGGWNGREKVKEALEKELRWQISKGFEMSVSIAPKGGET